MTAWPGAGESLRSRVPGPAGDLDTLVETTRETWRETLAVVCHPHPQYGGSKENKVVYTLARAARELGCHSLRFDFRGVGDSQGGFDDGVGEVEDVLAVLDWAQRTSGCGRWLLMGFSFGAATALRAAMRQTPLGLVTAALPTAYFPQGLPRPDCPWLAVHGGRDDVADTESARMAIAATEPAPEWALLPEAGHFFHGQLSDLRAAVETQVSDWLDGTLVRNNT
ncbi:MAG: alpha/beta fold hydrolase [Salinisphaera sp.]|nr:alpha/beta fold hydrolase [Salinisphaera sp.]